MKYIVLVSLMFLSISASALGLRINGETLQGVTVDSVRVYNNTVEIRTDRELPSSECDGTPSEPIPTVPTVRCVNSESIQCGYNISNSEWMSTARVTDTIKIPKGKTLISSFRTSSNEQADFGRFSFTTPVSGVREPVNVWVSDSVMGESVSSRCDSSSVSYNYQVRTTTYPSFYCELNPDQVYYLHIEHVDKSADTSTMYRELTTN